MRNNGGYGFGPSMPNHQSKKKDQTKLMKKSRKQFKRTRESFRVSMGIKYKNDGNAAKREIKNKVVVQKTRQTLLEEPRIVPRANNLTCFSRPSNGMPSSSKLLPKITKKYVPSSSKPNNGVVSFPGTAKSSLRPTNAIDSSNKNANGGAPPLKKFENPRTSYTRLNNSESSLTKNSNMPRSSSSRPNNERVSPLMNSKKSTTLSKPCCGLVPLGKNNESLKSQPSLPRKEFSSVLKDDLNSSFGSLKDSTPSSIFGNSRSTLQNVNGEAQKESIDEHIQLDSRKQKSGLSENEGTDAEKFKSTGMEPMDCSTQLENRNISLVEVGRTIDDKLRKRTQVLSQENPEAHEDDDSEEGENRRPTKRRRKLILNDYEDDDDGEHNLARVEIDTAGLTTQPAVAKDSPIKVLKPFLSESLKLQHYGSLPIDEPVWSGLIKISSKENVSLAAHFSTKCCEEVWKLAGSLQPEIVVTKLSRMEAWPKSFETSSPTDDNIALYFLPCQMRKDADLDQLVKEVVENDMVLRAAIGEAEMLIFPSLLLPEQHRTFQEKPYLWAVFRPRKNKVIRVEVQRHCKGRCPEDKMGKQLVSHCSVGKEVRRVTGLNMDGELGAPEELGMEREKTPSVARTNTPSPATRAPTMDASTSANNRQIHPSLAVPTGALFGLDGELGAPEELGMEREQNPSVARTNTPSPATRAPTMDASTSANNGQIHPSWAVPTGALFGFVVPRTLRIEQLIQEMQREGAMVVAMRGEMIGSGVGQATSSVREEDKTPPSSS